jgi:hypothetical protein
MVDVITPWVSVKQAGTSLSFLEEDDILEGERIVVVIDSGCTLGVRWLLGCAGVSLTERRREDGTSLRDSVSNRVECVNEDCFSFQSCELACYIKGELRDSYHAVITANAGFLRSAVARRLPDEVTSYSGKMEWISRCAFRLCIDGMHVAYGTFSYPSACSRKEKR